MRINEYFEGVAYKRLSAVEVNPDQSNQHELNGVTKFKDILGIERRTLSADFIYLNEDPDEIIYASGMMTWYDSRENHSTRTEHRFYYSTNDVLSASTPGDLIIIAKQADNKVLVVVGAQGSTSEKQLLHLFNLASGSGGFKAFRPQDNDLEVDFPRKIILSHLGIEIQEEDPSHLDEMIGLFGDDFPTTRKFSEFARSKCNHIDPVENPDKALLAWLEKEEILFKTFEKHLAFDILKNGFHDDIDLFIKVSLSIHNRRKSRAGHAFENHLDVIFKANGLRYDKGVKTERNNKPDFLFPGLLEYNSDDYPDNRLSMLGVKTTAKDRWRQILAEANKIDRKHLITLEPAISEYQTDEMKEQNIQLVIPQGISYTYSEAQQNDIINLKEYIKYLKNI